MKLVIETPKEFESHFELDRFDDSLRRLRTDAHCVAGKYEKELCDMLIAAFNSGTPLPKGHGDLIDRSKIRKPIPAEEDNCTGIGMTLEEMDAYNEGIDAMYSRVKYAPTIIEADKGEQNGW